MYNPSAQTGGSGYSFAPTNIDPSLGNIKMQLEELNKVYTNNGPDNIFKMPIYQLCANPQDVFAFYEGRGRHQS